MTNREAAEIMKAIIFILENDYYSDEVEEAIHMAINALNALDENAQHVQGVGCAGDAIRRQAMNDDKMKIGDEVAFHWDDGRPDTVVVITHIGYDGFIDGMDAKGTLYASKNPQKWTKTGRYFPLVTQLLRQMRDEKLPSAQPEPIRINLNELIKVKLTDWGKEIYYHQYDRTNQIAGREICKPRFPREDENGYTEFQLWCFIELYGMHMGMALPNVIEPLEIVYERRQE